jgi:hypothetical protein
MKPALLLVVLAVALPARAADKPLRLSGGPKSEDALRKFVTSDKRLKAKLDDAAAREEAFLAENRDSDLRDAVSDTNGPDELKRQLAVAADSDRARLLQQLPGLKSPAAPACATLTDCATPDLAADVTDAELLPDAVRRLVRPWMLLQQARGSELELSPVSAEGDAFLTVTLKDSAAAPLTLNVSPRLLGGFKIWFDQPLVLASLYDRERTDALKSVR